MQLPKLPSPCARCAQALPETTEGLICGQCLQHPPHYDRLYTPYAYAAPLAQLMTGFKYHQRLVCARLFSGLLLNYLLQHTVSLPQCLIPVPLHPQRQRQRGYNQALEIARPLSRRLGLPIESRWVRRQRATQPQADLSASQRHKNLAGAFTVMTKFDYQHVAIVDDVVTTGCTVNELARVLKQSGVVQVDVWSVARTLQRASL